MSAKRIYTPEEKLRIVLEGMSGTMSVADLCRKYDLKPARFYYWRDQLLNSAPEIFENRGRKVDNDRIRAEKDHEQRRIMRSKASRQPSLRLFRRTWRLKKDWRTLEKKRRI